MNVGGFNLHVDVDFDDGVTWLARFRLLRVNRPSRERVNFDRLSEVATYQLLRTTTIPVPRVFDFASDDPDNEVGAGYILFEKIPGHPMNWSLATPEQKSHVFDQLIDIYLQLEDLPMPAIGRPVFESQTKSGVAVGPAFFDYDAKGASVPCGPYSTTLDWYTALLNHRALLIDRGEFGTAAPHDALLANRHLYSCLRAGIVENEFNFGPFFLRHVDTRDVNFLVDDSYTITGILDWELAIFAPKEYAFQSPLFMFDMGHVLSENRLSPDDECFADRLETVGRHDLARLVRGGRKPFMFEMCMRTDPHTRPVFEEHLCVMQEILGGELWKVRSWDAWKASIQKTS